MQRRLIAILAADVAGYSRLMSGDEAGTHARLRDLRQDVIEPGIGEHGGRIVKLMGDGLLAEFASVVDAVTCAVALQADVGGHQRHVPENQRMALRIGINIGDIITEGDDIYGDGVNVVARLEALAKPGSICVSRTVKNHVKNKVDFGFEPMGEHRLKNIDEPVAVYRVLADPGPITKAIGLKSAGTRRLRSMVAATALIIVVLAGSAGFALGPWAPGADVAVREDSALPLPDKPSIAVLPFDNLGRDPEQEYFADGMTDDLITDLSKMSGVFVIARNSSFAYKSESPDVREVASDLGVRYILEGSVRRASDQVRVNVQLIDAKTGGHVWADRYDGTLADVFALQDQITRRVVIELAGQLSLSGRDLFTHTVKPEAYDSFLRGRAHFRKHAPEHYKKAEEYFQKAVELDPNYARAHAMLAWIYWNARYDGWYDVLGVGTLEAKRRAEEFLGKAMARPTSVAYQVAANMALWRGEYEEAISDAREAIELDPNDPGSLAALADVLIWNGTPEEAIPLLERARRIDPYNAAEYDLLHGRAQFHMGEFAAAATLLETSLELNPDLWLSQTLCEPCVLLLSAYGHLGEERSAARMDRRLKAINAQYINGINRYWFPYRESEDFERLANGLRNAGVSM